MTWKVDGRMRRYAFLDNEYLWVSSSDMFEYQFEGEYMEDCFIQCVRESGDRFSCQLFVNMVNPEDSGSYERYEEAGNGTYEFHGIENMTPEISYEAYEIDEGNLSYELDEAASDLYACRPQSIADRSEELMDEYLDMIG